MPDITRLKPYKSIVVIESPVSQEWQWAVSQWLVETGCLYMMAWGEGCSTWDDSVDMANLEAFDFGDTPEKDFVMTTWHESEPLEEVFRFAKTFAIHSEVELANTLILHIAASAKSAELMKMYASA